VCVCVCHDCTAVLLLLSNEHALTKLHIQERYPVSSEVSNAECIVLGLLLLFYYCCFCHIDFTLKSGTFGVPGLVLPGRGTAWDKYGTSQDRWQP